MKNKNPKMTRQHFEAVANIIASHNNINTDQKRSLINSFIKYFKTQNKNFDSFKFYNKSMVNNYNNIPWNTLGGNVRLPIQYRCIGSPGGSYEHYTPHIQFCLVQ